MALPDDGAFRLEMDRKREQQEREREMQFRQRLWSDGADDARKQMFPRLQFTPDYMAGYKSVNPLGHPLPPPDLRR